MANIADAFRAPIWAGIEPQLVPAPLTINSLTLSELKCLLHDFQKVLSEDTPEQFDSSKYPEHYVAIMALTSYMQVDASPQVTKLDILFDARSVSSRQESGAPPLATQDETTARFHAEIQARGYAQRTKTTPAKPAEVRSPSYILKGAEVLVKLDEFQALIKNLLDIEKYNEVILCAEALKKKIGSDLDICTKEHERAKMLISKLEELRNSINSIKPMRDEAASPVEPAGQREMLTELYSAVSSMANVTQDSVPTRLLENRLLALTKLQSIITEPLRLITRTTAALYCPICMEQIAASKFVFNMGCGHTFCKDCAERITFCANCRIKKDVRPLYIIEDRPEAPAEGTPPEPIPL
jgi:hypothetical protein